MRYESREDRLANNYRKVEAMYRRGFNVNDIARAIGLSLMDTYDITQKIFALDIKKKNNL